MKRFGGAQECYAILAKRYAGTAYVVLPQVANGTGAGAGRWLDVVVASLWPSRGLWLHGFEIKVARYDWLRELKQAEKADALFQHLDYFSVLTTANVVEKGELPETWGHVECDLEKKKLATRKEAPRISTRDSIDRGFVMSLFRSFDKLCGAGDEAQRMKAEYERGEKTGRADAEYQQKQRREAAMMNQAFLDAFQQAHGMESFSISPEAGTRLGVMFKRLHEAQGWGKNMADLRTRLIAAADLLGLMDGHQP